MGSGGGKRKNGRDDSGGNLAAFMVAADFGTEEL